VSHLIRNWPRKNVIQLALGIVAVTVMAGRRHAFPSTD
jgi:hypothetical protein